MLKVSSFGDVVGQSIWSVSQRAAPPNLEFQGNDYWWMTNWATDGTLAMSRWNIGDHVNRGTDENAHEMIWLTQLYTNFRWLRCLHVVKVVFHTFIQ